MTTPGDLGGLLDRRIERPVSAPVDEDAVRVWCETFGWTRSVDRSTVPRLAYSTFLRPAAPAEGAAPTGVILHDELKRALDLPVAIAVGYELELLGDLRCGQRLEAVERIAELGEERSTSLGPARGWVIDVAATTTDGVPVGVERFRMLGYRPGGSGRRSSAPRAVDVAAEWTEELEIDATMIQRSARANRVWALAHHDRDAAVAAGLTDIILDTSSQVALFTSAARARRRRPNAEPSRVSLTMRRPVLPGSTLVICGVDDGRSATVWATVDGRETSRAVITFEG